MFHVYQLNDVNIKDECADINKKLFADSFKSKTKEENIYRAKKVTEIHF